MTHAPVAQDPGSGLRSHADPSPAERAARRRAHLRLVTWLLLAQVLLAGSACAAVVWKARHGGDQAGNLGRIPMPYHQAFGH